MRCHIFRSSLDYLRAVALLCRRRPYPWVYLRSKLVRQLNTYGIPSTVRYSSVPTPESYLEGVCVCISDKSKTNVSCGKALDNQNLKRDYGTVARVTRQHQLPTKSLSSLNILSLISLFTAWPKYQNNTKLGRMRSLYTCIMEMMKT